MLLSLARAGAPTTLSRGRGGAPAPRRLGQPLLHAQHHCPFLNKRDLFAEKIKKHPIASIERFNDTGGDDFDLGCKYFEQKFVDKHHGKGAEAVLYKHVTWRGHGKHPRRADAAKRTILDVFAGAGLL